MSTKENEPTQPPCRQFVFLETEWETEDRTWSQQTPRRRVMPETQYVQFQAHRSSRGCWLATNVCLTYKCWLSDIWMLTISDKGSLSTVSCSWRRWWQKQGEQRRTCLSRGMLNGDLSIIRASWADKRRRRHMADRSLEILSSKQDSSALPLLRGALSNVLSSGLKMANL